MHVQWTNPMSHVQRTNPIYGICCMYKVWVMHKRPNLWGHNARYKEPDACTEDQSNGTVHVATCIYAQSQVRALCQV